MTNAYSVPIPPPEGLPPGLVVRVVVMRGGGGSLTRAELDACAALYPPPAGDHGDVETEAPHKATRGPAKSPKRTTAKKASSPAPKAPKRTAAKRPAK